MNLALSADPWAIASVLPLWMANPPPDKNFYGEAVGVSNGHFVPSGRLIANGLSPPVGTLSMYSRSTICLILLYSVWW